MAEETLLTAARRAVRYFDCDMAKGGLITSDTELAIETLRKEVHKEAAREAAQLREKESA
jgi:hypothetical protein